MFPFGSNFSSCYEYESYVKGELSREEWILASFKRSRAQLDERVLVGLAQVIVHMLNPDPHTRCIPFDAESTISAAFCAEQSNVRKKQRNAEQCTIH